MSQIDSRRIDVAATILPSALIAATRAAESMPIAEDRIRPLSSRSHTWMRPSLLMTATRKPVSLTVNAVDDRGPDVTHFTVNLIPHTQAVTTLGTLTQGQAVNIEIDVLARYLQRMQVYAQGA